MSVAEIIYPDSDNEIRLILVNLNDKTNLDYPRGNPIDFLSQGVTKMELCIENTMFNVTYSDDGLIVIKIGMNDDVESISKSIAHGATLKVFDPAHPNGQYLIHPKMSKSNLTLEVAESTC